MGLQQWPPQQAAPVTHQTGRKNSLRNGDFGIWQRGKAQFNIPDGGSLMTADGWEAGSNFSSGQSYATHWNGFGLEDEKDFLILVSQGQSGVDDYCYVQQKVEGVHTLAGKRVTLSVRLGCSVGSGSVAVELKQNFGTGGAPSAEVQTPVAVFTVTSGARKWYTVSFDVPSVDGKTLGSNDNDYLCLVLWTSAGSNRAARTGGIGLQNWNVEVHKAQLEEGSLATPFERLPLAEQLAWCQRYFWRSTGSAEAGNANHGFGMTGSSSNNGVIYVDLPVPMRKRPTMAWQGPLAVADAAVATQISTLTQAPSPGMGSNNKRVALQFTTATNTLGTYRPYYLENSSSASAYVEFSAEL